MGLLSDFAYTMGEVKRMSRTAKEEEKRITPEYRKKFNRNLEMANSGNTDAMFAIGSEYWLGNNVRYDPHEAVEWWSRAAENGHVIAMYNLGVAYEGNESHQFYDENLAGYWFNEAAIRGDEDAQRALKNYRYSRWRKRWIRVN